MRGRVGVVVRVLRVREERSGGWWMCGDMRAAAATTEACVRGWAGMIDGGCGGGKEAGKV